MFRYRVTLFSLFGFKVSVDASWLLLAVLITWSLAVGYFPQAAPGLPKETYWWLGVAGLIGFAFSIVFHELSHSLVARRFDMPIRGITLFVFGGVAEMEDEPPGAKAEFWMAIAGPLMSFFLALVFFLLGGLFVEAGAAKPTPLAVLFGLLAYINTVLGVFNLVPAFPLDGGRVLRAALWYWKGDIAWATRVAASAGSVFGFVLIAIGLVNAVTGNIVGGLWWFLIGRFFARGGRRRSVAADRPLGAVGPAGPPVHERGGDRGAAGPAARPSHRRLLLPPLLHLLSRLRG
jgi:Zn-dependent protease